MPDAHPGSVPSLLWTVSRILEATGGKLLSGSTSRRFSAISIDSRQVPVGALFIAIVGPKYDGHRFAADAVEKGARGILVERRRVRGIPLKRFRDAKIACISVPDTVRALGDLAAFYRRRWGGRVVAITGSNGKTTTRKMVAEVVRQGYPTLSASGNFNNEIGVPLTLLNLNQAHRWAVVELGMNHFGEIERLAQICRPDIGVITNIAPAHLEGVGSVEGVVRAKGELLANIRKQGSAVLNADDPHMPQLARHAVTDVLYFGRTKNASVRAVRIRETQKRVGFLLQVPGRAGVPVNLQTPGRFMVSNALASAAVGHLLGLSPDRIRKGLEAFVPEKGRMAVGALKNGVHLIDDTYNANPGSMRAAIDTLMRLKGKAGVSHVVLGDMLELGNQSESLHRELGAYLQYAGASKLYVTGTFARAVAAGAVAAGMPKEDFCIGNKGLLFERLAAEVRPGDWILVKGSRGMAMETLVRELISWAEPGRGSNKKRTSQKKLK